MKITLLLFFSSLFGNCDFVTNPFRIDGFGAQFQTIIYAAVYAELNSKPFYYTPFTQMEHNYDHDPEFLKKKEALIHFVDTFPINTDPQNQTITAGEFISFFETHLQKAATSKALKKIRRSFRINKKKSDYFDEAHFHVALHIRRFNSHDCRNEGTDVSDAKYLKIIDCLRKAYATENLLIHIFSQGDVEVFESIYGAYDVVFHLNESVETTFSSLVFADALVTSTSSLSYTAAMLSESVVYYMEFWHPRLPLANWVFVSDLIR